LATGGIAQTVGAFPDAPTRSQGHPSWRSILGFYVKGMVLAAVAAALAAGVTRVAVGRTDATTAGAAVAVVVGLVVLVGLVRRIATTYSISNQRLQIRGGLVARRVQETPVDRVQNVNISQGVLQRILQVGTLDFDTAGTGDWDFAFTGASQPEEVMKAVGEAQRRASAGAS
jgi:uncharacterized membrane protein YdbT with pleckstrin-like domain